MCCDLLKISYLCTGINNSNRVNCSMKVVVICLKFRIFAQVSTTDMNFIDFNQSCDLLKISYLCTGINNCRAIFSSFGMVVICLKFRIFAQVSTTPGMIGWTGTSCDLLKISYLCTGINNGVPSSTTEQGVVICLKFRIFAQVSTTYQRQHFQDYRCDLLKISYLCTGINNCLLECCCCRGVVICLKFRIFAQVSTTYRSSRLNSQPL